MPVPIIVGGREFRSLNAITMHGAFRAGYETDLKESYIFIGIRGNSKYTGGAWKKSQVHPKLNVQRGKRKRERFGNGWL